MKNEAKEVREMAKELVNVARAACTLGVCISAIGSAVLAGLLTIVVAAIGVVCYLNGVDLFGSRQWSIMLALAVVGVFSVIMWHLLNQKCNVILGEDYADEADDTDDADDELSKLPASVGLTLSALACLILFGWLFLMGWFCYMAGELDTAGFSVAEVAAIEVLAMTILGVILNKISDFEL